MSRARNKKLTPLPEGVEVGKPVSYYANGWRFGTLAEIKGNEAGVKGVGTYLHAATRLKWVKITDLKAVTQEKGGDSERSKH